MQIGFRGRVVSVWRHSSPVQILTKTTEQRFVAGSLVTFWLQRIKKINSDRSPETTVQKVPFLMSTTRGLKTQSEVCYICMPLAPGVWISMLIIILCTILPNIWLLLHVCFSHEKSLVHFMFENNRVHPRINCLIVTQTQLAENPSSAFHAENRIPDPTQEEIDSISISHDETERQ